MTLPRLLGVTWKLENYQNWVGSHTVHMVDKQNPAPANLWGMCMIVTFWKIERLLSFTIIYIYIYKCIEYILQINICICIRVYIYICVYNICNIIMWIYNIYIYILYVLSYNINWCRILSTPMINQRPLFQRPSRPVPSRPKSPRHSRPKKTNLEMSTKGLTWTRTSGCCF